MFCLDVPVFNQDMLDRSSKWIESSKALMQYCKKQDL